ncbi:MAG: outer membrane lipoprotein-sorting protein [Candidatus Omnitrophica bacterium]|nr:outer membrane lipoprotein-sorting protein [Candidatus Omnitrophota bacterium]
MIKDPHHPNRESRTTNHDRELAGAVNAMSAGLSFMMCALAVFAPMASAIDAGEIIGKCRAAAYSAGKDSRSEVRMVTERKDGAVTEKEMTLLSIDIGDNGAQRYYIRINKPPASHGLTYMIWKNTDLEDDVWQYIPGADGAAHFPAGEERSAFEGSCLTFEDISGRGAEKDTHTLHNDEPAFWVLKSVSRDSGPVEFSYYLTWVDKSTYLPGKVEFYDKGGRMYKRTLVLEVKEIQGIPTVVAKRTQILSSGTNTLWSVSGTAYNQGLSEDIFTERSMKEPPVELGGQVY